MDPIKHHLCPSCDGTGLYPPPSGVGYSYPQYHQNTSTIPMSYYPNVSNRFYSDYGKYYNLYYPRKKEVLGISSAALGFIVVILICVLIGIGIYAVIFTLPSDDDEIYTETYTRGIAIAEGGHYKYTPYDNYWDGIEITISLSSVDGKRFDLYIMDKTQYNNFYGRKDLTTISFSALYSFENITTINHTINWTDKIPSPFYIVIDNRDTTFTPDDATPNGSLKLDTFIVIRTRYEFNWD